MSVTTTSQSLILRAVSFAALSSVSAEIQPQREDLIVVIVCPLLVDLICICLRDQIAVFPVISPVSNPCLESIDLGIISALATFLEPHR